MTIANRGSKAELLLNLGTALVAVLATNALIAIANPREMSSYRASSLSPPGYVIGLVWTGLFLCMGVARWSLIQANPESRGVGKPIVWLAVLCLLYPLYTSGLRSESVGLAGNIVTLLFTVWVIRYSASRSRAAAFWISPVAAWLLFATAVIVQQVRR